MAKLSILIDFIVLEYYHSWCDLRNNYLWGIKNKTQ